MIRGAVLHTVGPMPQHLPHIARGLRLAPVFIAAALAASPPAFATYPGHNGRLAFYSITDSGPQIFTVRKHGRDLRQLTHVTTGEAKFPDWSPDGTHMAVTRTTWFCERCDLEGVAIAALANETITMIAQEVVDPSWSPDGSQLVALKRTFAEDMFELVILDLQGRSRTLIAGKIASPAWQPVR